MSVTISCLNQRLIMRLLPMKEPDKAWRSVKAQWKKDAEGVGEDFSTFASGSYAAFDSLIKDNSNPSLYCLSDGERVHAVCQVSRLMMSKYSTPMLRARFVSVSPVYELGLAGAGEYAQIMVALFSGIVWLCGLAVGGPYPVLPQESWRFPILHRAADLDAAVAVFDVHDRRGLDRVQFEGSGSGGNGLIRLGFLTLR